MKRIIITIGIASLLGLAIPCSAQFGSDSCGCPPPVDDGFGLHIPADYDIAGSISPDGKWLAYDGRVLLNLQTLERLIIYVDGGLPNEDDVTFTNLVWCPYDPDLLALNVDSYIDTSNNGNWTEVENIFTYRVSTGESQLITPQIYNPVSHGDRIIGSWLPGSKPGADSIVVQYGGQGAIYVPQSQTLIPVPFPGINGVPEILARSADEKHTVSIVNDTIPARDSQWFYLNDVKIRAPRNIRIMDYASFSPDSKIVALTVDPIGDSSDGPLVFEQVWIFSADSAAPSSVKIINFQCLYCMYNVLGAYAVFLTDSTLAVSMHKDGSDTSALYEITLDGRIVRQLTYVAQSGVANANPSDASISVDANPFANTSSVTVRLNSPDRVDVGVSDILGRMVYRYSTGEVLEAGEHHIPIDLSQSQAGTYYLRVRLGTGEVQTVKLVKE